MDRFFNDMQEKIENKDIWIDPDRVKGLKKLVKLRSIHDKMPLLNELIGFWKSDAYNEKALKDTLRNGSNLERAYFLT